MNKSMINGIILFILAISIGANVYYIPKTYDLIYEKDKCLEDNKSYNKNENTNNKEEKWKEEKEEYKEPDNYTYSTKDLIEISFKDFSKKSKDKEIIIVFGRQDCYWCSLYIPILTELSNTYKFDLYYYDFGKLVNFNANLAELSNPEEYNQFLDWITDNGYGSEIENGIGTPMTFFVKDNKIEDIISGYYDKDEVIKRLDREGFIK